MDRIDEGQAVIGEPLSADELAVRRITESQRILFKFIVSLVGSPEDAEDILQDTNVVLWRKWNTFEGRSSFSTWACRIAFNNVVAWRKRQNRRSLLVLDDDLLAVLADMSLADVDRDDDRLDAMRACLSKMSRQARELLQKRYTSGMSVVDIAGQIGRSVVGLRVTFHRLRRQLANCINARIAAEGA